MSKTPEEMAEEYIQREDVACAAINHAAEDLVKAAFLDGYEAATPQWISVKERLPEENIKVLVLCRKRITAAALTRVEEPFYEAGYFRVWTAYPISSTDPYKEYPWNGITHWMPLPEPPREGE